MILKEKLKKVVFNMPEENKYMALAIFRRDDYNCTERFQEIVNDFLQNLQKDKTPHQLTVIDSGIYILYEKVIDGGDYQ